MSMILVFIVIHLLCHGSDSEAKSSPTINSKQDLLNDKVVRGSQLNQQPKRPSRFGLSYLTDATRVQDMGKTISGKKATGNRNPYSKSTMDHLPVRILKKLPGQQSAPSASVIGKQVGNQPESPFDIYGTWEATATVEDMIHSNCFQGDEYTDACATCGYYALEEDAQGPYDCVTCPDGYEIDVDFSDCTGYCVPVGTAGEPLSNSTCEIPSGETVTLTNFGDDGELIINSFQDEDGLSIIVGGTYSVETDRIIASSDHGYVYAENQLFLVMTDISSFSGNDEFFFSDDSLLLVDSDQTGEFDETNTPSTLFNRSTRTVISPPELTLVVEPAVLIGTWEMSAYSLFFWEDETEISIDQIEYKSDGTVVSYSEQVDHKRYAVGRYELVGSTLTGVWEKVFATSSEFGEGWVPISSEEDEFTNQVFFIGDEYMVQVDEEFSQFFGFNVGQVWTPGKEPIITPDGIDEFAADPSDFFVHDDLWEEDLYFESYIEELIIEFDFNGDSIVSPQDMSLAMELEWNEMSVFDENNDGALDFNEFAAWGGRALAEEFEENTYSNCFSGDGEFGACATCGYYERQEHAQGDYDCVSCPDGYEIDVHWFDCTGYCVPVGTASEPLLGSDCESPTPSDGEDWSSYFLRVNGELDYGVENQIQMEDMDVNGNGSIDENEVMALAEWFWEDLVSYDANNDGVIDSRDFVGLESRADTTAIAQAEELPTATGYQLNQNYPNPFNGSTSIHFTLPRTQRVEIHLFNLLGQNVAKITDAIYSVGHHQVTWDKAGITSGCYIYRLKTEDFELSRKMVVLE